MKDIAIGCGLAVRRVVDCPENGLSLDLASGSTLDLLIVCKGYNGRQQIEAALAKDSCLNLTVVDLNSELLDRKTVIDLNGQGARCDVRCVALCSGDQQNSNRIVVNHNVENCSSDQLFRSVVSGSANVVFNGLIYVAPGANGTVAMQNSRNILLSDTAKVDTQPQLEIYADDVKCNHGAATGSFDENAIYYMRQRGISFAAARALLLQGFCLQVLDENWQKEACSLPSDIIDRLSTL